MSRRSNPAKVEQWTACLARFQDSGLTVAEFCRKEGVSPASFYQWRRKLPNVTNGGGAVRRMDKLQGEKEPAGATSESRIGSAFQSVEVLPVASAATIRIPNGVVIELGSDLRAFDLLARRLLDGSTNGKDA